MIMFCVFSILWLLVGFAGMVLIASLEFYKRWRYEEVIRITVSDIGNIVFLPFFGVFSFVWGIQEIWAFFDIEHIVIYERRNDK